MDMITQKFKQFHLTHAWCMQKAETISVLADEKLQGNLSVCLKRAAPRNQM
jgi:hypothetical protein